jgi:hypothetical protein
MSWAGRPTSRVASRSAVCSIAQHFGRPGSPTDQAWIETLWGRVKHEHPHQDRRVADSVAAHLAQLRAAPGRPRRDGHRAEERACDPADRTQRVGVGGATAARRRSDRRAAPVRPSGYRRLGPEAVRGGRVWSTLQADLRVAVHHRCGPPGVRTGPEPADGHVRGSEGSAAPRVTSGRSLAAGEGGHHPPSR